LNDSLRFFWEEILRKNKVMAALFSTIVFVVPVENGFDSVFIALSILLVYIISSVLCSVLSDKIPEQFRIYLYICINIVLSFLITLLISCVKVFKMYDDLIMYIPLIATGCGLFVAINRPWTERTVKNSVKDAIFVGGIASVTIVVFGIFREIFGNATFFSVKIPFLSEFVTNFKLFEKNSGAYILMGFLMAVVLGIQGIISDKNVSNNIETGSVKENAGGES